MTVPMYIAESAPPDMRGRLVTFNNLFITGGQFAAGVVDGVFSYDKTNGWRYGSNFYNVLSQFPVLDIRSKKKSLAFLMGTGTVWYVVATSYFLQNTNIKFYSNRFMLGLAGIPSLIQFFGFIFMPESPRWLVGKDREFEARNASFASIRYENNVISLLASDKNVHKNEEVFLCGFGFFRF